MYISICKAQQICEIFEENIDNVIREMKTLYLNFENVTSDI